MRGRARPGRRRRRGRGARGCCLFCSLVTVELKQKLKNPDKKYPHRLLDKGGLRCSVCNSFACQRCLSLFQVQFTKEMIREDPWCDVVNRYITEGFNPNYFLGHCCQLNRQFEEEDGENESNGLGGALVIPEYGLLLETTFTGMDVLGLGQDDELGIDGAYHALYPEGRSQQLEPIDNCCTTPAATPPRTIEIPKVFGPGTDKASILSGDAWLSVLQRSI